MGTTPQPITVGFTALPILQQAKSWACLAQSAYDAYCKAVHRIDDEGFYATQAWADLPDDYRQCWVNVAQQLWAEHTAMRSLVGQAFALDGEASDPNSVVPGTRRADRQQEPRT